jgi:hypothetical protein
MDTAASHFPPEDIRASDAERDQALAELSEHFQTGRLTQDEYDQRSGLALKARTGRDLSALFGDLPRHPASALPGPRPAAAVAATGPGGGAPACARPALRVVIPVAVLAIIAGNLYASLHSHGTLTWLLPAAILALVFARIAARGQRPLARNRRSRRLLETTNTELNAIAAAATSGLSRPDAASGRAATL